jgi:protein-disulfide isomerase
MDKQFIAVILVVLAGLFGIFALTNNKDGGSNGGGGANASQATNYVAGKTDSKVNLTEYGDFQCPACKQYYPIFKELKQTYGDRVAFQFRHFPLVQIHPNAFIASRAAEAAGRQGKFYEMHDQLYESQDQWSRLTTEQATATFESYAQQLALNIDQYKTDFNSASVASAINADMKAGQGIQANSTPTFALNGKKIENPRSLDEFKKVLDDALAQNQ